MFTIDPSTGADDRLVIEGSFGLGEAVVSGSVSPDRYVVDKGTLAVDPREVRRKEFVDRAAAGGGTVHARADRGGGAAQPALSDDEARALAALGRTDRAALRLAAGHRVGDRRRRHHLDAAVPAGHGRRHGRGHGEPATVAGRVLLRGLGAAPGRASGPVRVLGIARRWRLVGAGRCARGAHDRARLGAADAPGGGDRHRLRRHDLPRRDRLARAGHPVRRRHRPLRRRRCVTASWSPSTRHGGSCSRGAATPAVVSPTGPTAAAASPPAATATQLLLNLSEPSQVERAAALDVDGVGCCGRS